MKVGITGGTGTIGKTVIEEFKTVGWDPYVFSRQDAPNVISTDYSIKNLTNKFNKLDAIVHLAAPRSQTHFLEDYFQSIEITQNVYEACKNNKITNIVYASSISVYQQNLEFPWREDNDVVPQTMYGLSKLIGEILANYYHDKYDLNVKSLRFAHVYGFNEKNNYMINLFMRQAFNSKILTIDTKSRGKREFLYTKDAARAIVCALKNSDVHGSFNIGSESVLTNEEVAKSINKIFNNENNITIDNPKSFDTIPDSYMNLDKARRVLNYEPQYSFENALEEIYSDMMEIDYVPEYY